jgi:hypothetical protein
VHCRTPLLLVSAHRAMLKSARNPGLVDSAGIIGEFIKPIDAAAFASLSRDIFAPFPGRARG